jgi:hypothetical protein
MVLLQRLDRLGHLRLTAQFPVVHQFYLVQFTPFEHMTKRARWKSSFNNAGFDLDRDFEFAIFRMKVGGAWSFQSIVITMPRNRLMMGMVSFLLAGRRPVRPSV